MDQDHRLGWRRGRWLVPALLGMVAAMLGGGYALVLGDTGDDSRERRSANTPTIMPAVDGDAFGGAPKMRADVPDVPSDDETGLPREDVPAADEPASGGSGDGDRSYLDEERCQPVDDMNDPTDGSVPSPEELLPDPVKCPEFYRGSGGSSGSAPPVSGVPPVPGYTPGGVPVAPPYTPKPGPEPPPAPGLDPDEFRLGDPTPHTNDPTPGVPPGTQPNY